MLINTKSRVERNQYFGFSDIECDAQYLTIVSRTARLQVSGQQLEAVSVCIIAAEGNLLICYREPFEGKKSIIPPFSSLLCWTRKNLWCLVFSDNFLIASFLQEKPCLKVQAHIQVVKVDGTEFWKNFVCVEQIKWPVR